MKVTSVISALGALAATTAALSLPNSHVVHERRSEAPRKWVKRDSVDSSRILPMRIGLKQSNLERGHDLLMDVSSHDSPRYSQWYSPEEIVDIFAPSQKSVDSVRSWLEGAGVAAHRISQSANKQWIQFDAAVEEAEALLKTKYHNFEHTHSGRVQIACDEYHLPQHVQEHIDYVQPGLRLMAGGKAHSEGAKEKRGFRTSGNQNFTGPILDRILDKAALPNVGGGTDLSQCDTTITPACIKAMYNITEPKLAAPGNQLGIFEEGDFYAAEDLIEFFALFAPNIPATTAPQLRGIDGGFAPGLLAGGESDLDFQISYPLIYPQQEVLFQTDDFFYASGLEGGGGFLNTFFDAIDGSYCSFSAYGETGDADIDPKYPDPLILGYQGQRQCGVYKPTNVISISYGEQEDDLPTNYQQRQCAEIMKLGMQGVSIVVASGDSGVAARGTDNGNANGCLGKGTVFNPDFPASCPYITAVGATFLPTGASAAKDQEVAVTRFPSGGGFSNIYAQPSYQSAAVNGYFANHNPSYAYYNTSGTNNPDNSTTANGSKIYNRGGRGYPDVSAVGDRVLIINNALPELIGGTSAAAPVFAAILNRINEERLAAGKKTVGFVNPALYAHPEAFHDITVGNNTGCGTPGFLAASGWDPVTGLGTPNYPSLLKVFMGLP